MSKLRTQVAEIFLRKITEILILVTYLETKVSCERLTKMIYSRY